MKINDNATKRGRLVRKAFFLPSVKISRSLHVSHSMIINNFEIKLLALNPTLDSGMRYKRMFQPSILAGRVFTN